MILMKKKVKMNRFIVTLFNTENDIFLFLIECFTPCGPKSPLNWICELGREKKTKKFTNKNQGNPTVEHSNRERNDPRNEARKKATQNFFRSDSDDEYDVSNHKKSNNMNSFNGSQPETLIPDVIPSTSNNTVLTNDNYSGPQQHYQPPQTYIHISTNDTTNIRPVQGEARIVAPHVSKLSPYSAVEVRLQSTSESVAVLCSVDVLKMRSGFFHDILNEQEKNLASKHSNSSVSINHPLQSNLLWRDPIIIPETSPFEAAAFLESLHEGRTLFKGEWNYCWARLRYETLFIVGFLSSSFHLAFFSSILLSVPA
jgi:hypothetical protein